MSTRIDLNKPSSEIALLLVNKNNGTDLTYTVVGITGAIAIDTSTTGKNTAATVHALPGQIYYGNVPLEYDRLDITEIIGNEINYVNGPVFTIDEVIAAINITYGLGLVSSEIEQIDFSANGTAIIKIADSLVYIDNKQFTIRDEFDHSVEQFWHLTNVVLPPIMSFN